MNEVSTLVDGEFTWTITDRKGEPMWFKVEYVDGTYFASNKAYDCQQWKHQRLEEIAAKLKRMIMHATTGN